MLLWKDFLDVDIEAQGTPNRVNTKQNKTPRHIIIQLLKIKDKQKILKEARENNVLPTEE